MNELSSKYSDDPKNYWSILKDIYGSKKSKNLTNVPIHKLFNHFKHLNSRRTHSNDTQNTFVHQAVAEGLLDSHISEKEIADAVQNTKNGKATGKGNIHNEFLKCSKNDIGKSLTHLFNTILSSGNYPEDWSFGFITPIHKKGNKTDPENYRGITVLSCLGKLFNSILNNRLIKYLEDNNILKDEQAGFRKGFRTTDNIFTLKTLIDKYARSQKKKKNNVLFSCFIDFKSVFDRISRTKLLHKMQKVGITGKFLSVISSVYSSDKSCLKIGNKIAESFQCHNGVKQGDILSPALFNLYLHDLPEQFETVNDPVYLDGRAIDCLLYADDLIVVSQTAEGLQGSLSKLQEFCSFNSMTINSDKTKIVLFNKPGKKLSRYHFHINGEHIDMATSYKYLGLTFSICGSFTTAKHELKKTAIKAFFKIRKEMGASFKSNVQDLVKIIRNSHQTNFALWLRSLGSRQIPTRNTEPNRTSFKHIL